MKKRTALSIAAGMSILMISPVPATTKPCRDKSGKIIECPKVRKPSLRCKDAQGRFVPCLQPSNADQVKNARSK